MTRLTDSQLILLSRAAQRDDGVLEDAGSMNTGAATRVAGALIQKKLMREIRRKSGMPEWRRDQDGRSWSLVITRSGRNVIGVVEDNCPERGEDSGQGSSADQTSGMYQSQAGSGGRKGDPDRQGRVKTGKSSDGSKRSVVISMLSKPSGASIEALVNATGWQHHTTRAVLTRLRQAGFAIDRKRLAGKAASTYRITSQPNRVR